MLEHRLVKCTNSKTTLLKCSVLHPSRMHVALQVRIVVSLSQKNIKQMIVQHAFSGCRTSSNIMFRSSLLYHHVDIMVSLDGHTCSTHTHVRGRIVCRSSVASTLTSNQFSITWWRVSGLSCLTFSKNVSCLICSRALLPHTDVHKRMCMWRFCRTSVKLRKNKRWLMAAKRVVLLYLFKNYSGCHRGHPWCFRALCSYWCSQTRFYV